MSLTTVVALYAALVATGALAWNVYVYFRSHRTDVWVEVNQGRVPGDAGKLGDPGKLEFALHVVAINHGDQTQFVQGLGLLFLDPDNKSWTRQVAEPKPRELPPGERSTTGPIRIKNRNLSEGYIGFVELASGDEFRSARYPAPPIFSLDLSRFLVGQKR